MAYIVKITRARFKYISKMMLDIGKWLFFIVGRFKAV